MFHFPHFVRDGCLPIVSGKTGSNDAFWDARGALEKSAAKPTNALLSIDYDALAAAASSSPSPSSSGGAKTIRSAPSAVFCIMLSRPWAFKWTDTTHDGPCLFQSHPCSTQCRDFVSSIFHNS